MSGSEYKHEPASVWMDESEILSPVCVCLDLSMSMSLSESEWMNVGPVCVCVWSMSLSESGWMNLMPVCVCLDLSMSMSLSESGWLQYACGEGNLPVVEYLANTVKV